MNDLRWKVLLTHDELYFKYYFHMFAILLILLIGEENEEANLSNEKSPLLEMREEINHVSNNEKRNVDDVIRRGRSLEMNQMPHHPEEAYCNPESVRKYLRKNRARWHPEILS